MEVRRGDLTLEKAVNANNEIQLRKRLAEEKSIDEAISRMSIGPMVKAGEFTSISEGETEVDAAVSEGEWIQKVNGALERLPAKLGAAGRYAAITRDTALFKGLARSVQYGDFLAKSIVYDHLTQRVGKTHEQAMKTVIDEFVAYNFLPSRERQAAEQLARRYLEA